MVFTNIFMLWISAERLCIFVQWKFVWEKIKWECNICIQWTRNWKVVTLDRVYLKLSSGIKEFRVFDLLLYEHANMWCVSWFHPCVDSLSCVYESCQQGCNFTSYLTWQMLPLSRPSLTSPLVLSPLLPLLLPPLPHPPLPSSLFLLSLLFLKKAFISYDSELVSHWLQLQVLLSRLL